MSVLDQKKKLRKEILSIRETLIDKDVIARSILLKNNFFSMLKDYAGKTVLGFMPFKNEIDVTLIIEELLRHQVKIVLPRVDKELHALRLYAVSDLTADVEPGVWGIREPIQSLEEIPPRELDYILIPGLAFDKERYRLGYGGGYYDRLLKNTNAVKIGVCYDFQRVEKVPTEVWDVPVDKIVTDTGWF